MAGYSSEGARPVPELFKKWSCAVHWGPEEGVAIAFGLDPDDVIDRQPDGTLSLNAPDPVRDFARRARNAVSDGELPENAQPSVFLDWAEDAGLVFHKIWTSTLGSQLEVGPDGRSNELTEMLKAFDTFIEERDTLIREWALAPTWTLPEGACLANNVSPSLLSEFRCLPRRHHMAPKVNRLIEFALRAMRESRIRSDVPPADFVGWSATVGFPFDPKWREAVGEPSEPRELVRQTASLARSGSRPPPAANAPAKESEPSTRTRETLLKIIIGIAIDAYGYDPRSRRSDVPKTVAEQLSTLGVPVTAETVRKYLDEAAKLLSEDALTRHFNQD